MTAPVVSHIVRISYLQPTAGTTLLWVGEGDLVLSGEPWATHGLDGTYKGKGADSDSVIEVSSFTDDGANTACVLSLNATPAAARARLLLDQRDARVVIRAIASLDGGEVWTLLPLGISGRWGTAQYSQGTVSVDVTERWGERGRGEVARWTHAAWKDNFGDYFFLYTTRPSLTFDTQWPPDDLASAIPSSDYRALKRQALGGATGNADEQ